MTLTPVVRGSTSRRWRRRRAGRQLGVEPLPRGGDDGAVTVELAVGLIGVVVLLGLVLLLTAAATAQLRCTEAARAGARAAALADDDAAVLAVARLAAGDGADVDVQRADGWVTVTVARAVAGPRDLGGLEARASSSTPVEP